MSAERFDVAIAGGGIVGLATAYALGNGPRPPRVVVLEAEERVAPHQTGHNSGVIHSGLYYKPGSLKASLCRDGRARLLRFCEERGVPYALSGKVLVATRESELPRLAMLCERAAENGLAGVVPLTAEQLLEKEPHARGLAALWVPEAGVVDYTAVATAMAAAVAERGGTVRTGARVSGVKADGAGIVVETASGAVACRTFVACAGLQADRLARLCGLAPSVTIVPFRGDYFTLKPERAGLVNALIYPVPDPRFPFLGVHFTRRISGVVEVGPSAVLALAREGYARFALSPRDALETALFAGFWKFVAAHAGNAAGELWRSVSAGAFAKAARELVPEVREEDLARAGCGIRAQAMRPDGTLVDDFEIQEAHRMLHVLNAPSPAATASLAIGETIAERVRGQLGA